jgi:hypothetical protein
MGGTAAKIGGSVLGGAFGGKGGEKQSQKRNESTNSISSNQSSSSSAPWEAQIPYLLEMFSRGRGMLDAAPGGNPLNQDAAAQIKKTLGGDYLFGNPESKKAIDAITEQTTNRVMPGIDSKFAASGRYGSGLHKQELGRQIADTSASEMAKNYNAERNNMMGAATAAPGVSDSLDWQSKRLKDFASLISGNYGGTTTGSSNSIMNSTGMSTSEAENPNNKLTSKIGGAMGGANIAGRIVGGNAGSGGVPGAKLPTPRFGSGK